MKFEPVMRLSYVVGSVILLFLTSIAKLHSSFGTARILERIDPILQITGRQVLIATAFIEIMVVLTLLFAKKPSTKYASCVWLATNFILYRWTSWYWELHAPCACLGSVTEKLGLKPADVNTALLWIVTYLFLGGLICLVVERLKNQTIRVPLNHDH